MSPAEKADFWALHEGGVGKSSSASRGMDWQQPVASASAEGIPTEGSLREDGLGNVSDLWWIHNSNEYTILASRASQRLPQDIRWALA